MIQPSIDVFSPKNADLDPEQSRSILATAGLTAYPETGPATFTRADGTPGRVDRGAELLEEAPLTPEDRLLVQVSRWDRLKDPLSVLSAFVEHVAERVDAHLPLAGPSTESVADAPEGAAVYASVASRIGGIQDQIVHGESGVLIRDPHNLAAYGSAVELLADLDRAERIGAAARGGVRENFLGPHHLGRYFELLERLVGT